MSKCTCEGWIKGWVGGHGLDYSPLREEPQVPTLLVSPWWVLNQPNAFSQFLETKTSTGLTIKQDKVGRIMGSHSRNRWLESGAGKLGLLGRQEAGRMLPTFGRAGDLFRGQAPEPGRVC